MYIFSYAHLHISTMNSPRKLNIYAKTAIKMKDLNTIRKNKHKKVVRNMKKIVSIRSLSLHTSTDGVYDEYLELLET